MHTINWLLGLHVTFCTSQKLKYPQGINNYYTVQSTLATTSPLVTKQKKGILHCSSLLQPSLASYVSMGAVHPTHHQQIIRLATYSYFSSEVLSLCSQLLNISHTGKTPKRELEKYAEAKAVSSSTKRSGRLIFSPTTVPLLVLLSFQG